MVFKKIESARNNKSVVAVLNSRMEAAKHIVANDVLKYLGISYPLVTVFPYRDDAVVSVFGVENGEVVELLKGPTRSQIEKAKILQFKSPLKVGRHEIRKIVLQGSAGPFRSENDWQMQFEKTRMRICPYYEFCEPVLAEVANQSVQGLLHVVSTYTCAKSVSLEDRRGGHIRLIMRYSLNFGDEEKEHLKSSRDISEVQVTVNEQIGINRPYKG